MHWLSKACVNFVAYIVVPFFLVFYNLLCALLLYYIIFLFLLICFDLCLQMTQFLDSHGFLDYLERGVGSDENNFNLLEKLQDAIGRGQNPISILPSSLIDPEIITISDQDVGTSGKVEMLYN